MAVGASGVIVTSTNGTDWGLVPSGVTNQLNTVAFGQGRFVIGGDHGTALWSDDGEHWTMGSVPLGYDIDVIAYGSTTNYPMGVFVAFGSTNDVFSGRHALRGPRKRVVSVIAKRGL